MQEIKLAYIFVNSKNKLAVNKLTTFFGQAINKKLVFANSDFASIDLMPAIRSVVTVTTIDQANKNDSFKNVLLRLALVAGRFSRFKIDKKIGEQKMEEMYNSWINSILDVKKNSTLITATSGREIIGFIAYKTVANINYIEFIAIDDYWQHKGIGKGLMKQLFENSKQYNITQIKVETQEENMAACNFYTACGFSVEQANSIYHIYF
jgi:ribosomal protein S18 acetylase RimI-like enzyme